MLRRSPNVISLETDLGETPASHLGPRPILRIHFRFIINEFQASRRDVLLVLEEFLNHHHADVSIPKTDEALVPKTRRLKSYQEESTKIDQKLTLKEFGPPEPP